NGLYVKDTVCQAAAPWQFNVSNITGNFQGAAFDNVYSETSLTLNGLSPVYSPWPGTGISGLIAGPSTGAASFSYHGNGGFAGQLPTYPLTGGGATQYVYFVVVNDTTTSTHTAPLPVMFGLCGTTPGSCSGGSINVIWPRVANGTDTVTYDVLRMTSPVGLGAANGGT